MDRVRYHFRGADAIPSTSITGAAVPYTDTDTTRSIAIGFAVAETTTRMVVNQEEVENPPSHSGIYHTDLVKDTFGSGPLIVLTLIGSQIWANSQGPFYFHIHGFNMKDGSGAPDFTFVVSRTKHGKYVESNGAQRAMGYANPAMKWSITDSQGNPPKELRPDWIIDVEARLG